MQVKPSFSFVTSQTGDQWATGCWPSSQRAPASANFAAVRHAILELFARLPPQRRPQCRKWICSGQGVIKSEAAIDYLRRALHAAPDYADAMFNLALLLQRGSRHKEAAEC